MSDVSKIFYGEVGVQIRHPAVPVKKNESAGEYDHDNPDGSEYTRRNFGESCYISGMPTLSPAEYPWKLEKRPESFSAESP